MTGFDVLPAESQSCGAMLAQLAQVIDQLDLYRESAVEQAERRVNQLHTTWTGQAAQAHQAAHDEWKRGSADMRAGLATMRAIASTAHSNYTKTRGRPVDGLPAIHG